MLTLVQIFSFSFCLWLGLYLLARNPGQWRSIFAGIGILVYGIGLGLDALIPLADDSDFQAALLRLRWSLVVFPPLMWFGAVVEALPDNATIKDQLPQRWNFLLVEVVGVLALFAAVSDAVFSFEDHVPVINMGYCVFAGIVLLPISAALGLTLSYSQKSTLHRPFQLLMMATIFFGLGSGLLVLPLEVLPIEWVIISVAIDLMILGLVIGWWDALDLGEAFFPDFVRSMFSAGAASLILGGQAALLALPESGLTFSILLLTLTLIATGIVLVIFSTSFQNALDELVFARLPYIRQERKSLREAADAVPRISPNFSVDTIDEEEFIRLTRRAISHYGDLSKLAASPLAQLPLIDQRLQARGARSDTLERARELKGVLTESIARLKPVGEEAFGTSDEWRHYNALYFPYVVGIKPYTRRWMPDDVLDSSAQAALDWFQTQIPERTLYNWQNAAAKLIAQDLKEKSGSKWQ